MSLITDIKALTPIQKNQQFMSFYLLFVNALLIATTTLFYVDLFGADGMILKSYIASVYGLVLLIPALGKWAQSNPLRTFKVALLLEVMSIVSYVLVTLDYYAMYFLPLASAFILSSGLIMRPILTQVSSIVTNGCAHYSLVSSKMDSIYTSIGAGVGILFVLFDVPNTVSIITLALALGMSRLYRKRVLEAIYNNDNTETNSVLIGTLKSAS